MIELTALLVGITILSAGVFIANIPDDKFDVMIRKIL